MATTFVPAATGSARTPLGPMFNRPKIRNLKFHEKFLYRDSKTRISVNSIFKFILMTQPSGHSIRNTIQFLFAYKISKYKDEG